MNNLLMCDVKVGDMIQHGFKIIKVGRIQMGMPNGVITGYDQYGQWCRIPFKNC